MSTGNEKKISEDLRKDAEHQRLVSETAKNEAERLKLELERKEIEKRLQQRWFSGRIIIQSAIGGLVAAALLATWGIGYLRPILLRSLELNELETEINIREINKLKEFQKEINSELVKVKEENENLINERNRIIVIYENRLEKIDPKLKDLKRKSKSEQLDHREEKIKRELESEVASISTQLGDLRDAQREAAIRIESLKKLTSDLGFLCVTSTISCLMSEPVALGQSCSCPNPYSDKRISGIIE